MKLLLRLCTALLVLGSGAALAGPATFGTGPSQLCVGASGCGVATQTIGGGTGVTVTFTPVGPTTVTAAPSIVTPFGQLTVSCVGGGTACGSQSLAGLNLYVNIAQTAPSVGNSSISGGVITGSISGTVSTASITWSVPNTVQSGTIRYGISSNPISLLQPNTGGGVVTVQGIVTDTTFVAAIPALSPASLAALIGAMGLFAAWRIRRSPRG